MGYFTGKTVIVTGAGRATLKNGDPGSIGYGGSFGHLLLTGDTVLFSHGTVFDR